MRIDKRDLEDVVVLTFIGEFDAFNLEYFTAKIDALIDSGQHRLAFDLRRLTFINSAALGYLIRTKRVLEEKGGDLVIIRPSEFVSSSIETLGLDRMFEILDGDADVLDHFHGDADGASPS